MDDDDKDGFRGFFDRFGFGGLDSFFRDMNQHMEELTQHMEEMFKDSGEIHTGFHPPEMNGKTPPLREDPRDSMLKNADSPTTASTGVPQTQSPFRAPNTPISTISPWNKQDGNMSVSFFPANDSFVTGRMRSVQTTRKSDGSMERVEKTTENGRTCTTITRTDPEGNTTTNTTCDRPAIGDSGQGMVKPVKPGGPTTGISPPPTLDTILGIDSNPPNQSQDNAGFFTKFFKKFGFNKPDS